MIDIHGHYSPIFDKGNKLRETTEKHPMELFQKIDFTSHSGLDLKWKIEMDALSHKEWECIAQMIMELSPPFREAIGIPRGGNILGKLLNKHGTGKREDPICIVDDVLTTGDSMNEFRRKRHWRNPTDYIGWVVFARAKCPDWVTALFQMPFSIDSIDYDMTHYAKEYEDCGDGAY